MGQTAVAMYCAAVPGRNLETKLVVWPCGPTDKASDYESGVVNYERKIAIHVTRKPDTIWQIF